MTKKHVGGEVFPREVHEEVTMREKISNLVVEPVRDVAPLAVDKGKGVVDVGVQ